MLAGGSIYATILDFNTYKSNQDKLCTLESHLPEFFLPSQVWIKSRYIRYIAQIRECK